MAELTDHPSEPRTLAGDPGARAARAWTGAQTRAQFGAITRLRWQMYLNGFRRKGGKSDLAATLSVAPFVKIS